MSRDILEMVASKLILQNGRYSLAAEIRIYSLILLFSARCIFIFIWALCNSIVRLIIKLRTNGYFCDEVIVLSFVWNPSAYTQSTTQYYRVGNIREMQMRCILQSIASMLTWIVIRRAYSSYNTRQGKIITHVHTIPEIVQIASHYQSNNLMNLITITTWISLLVTISLSPSLFQLPTQMA